MIIKNRKKGEFRDYLPIVLLVLFVLVIVLFATSGYFTKIAQSLNFIPNLNESKPLAVQGGLRYMGYGLDGKKLQYYDATWLLAPDNQEFKFDDNKVFRGQSVKESFELNMHNAAREGTGMPPYILTDSEKKYLAVKIWRGDFAALGTLVYDSGFIQLTGAASNLGLSLEAGGGVGKNFFDKTGDYELIWGGRAGLGSIKYGKISLRLPDSGYAAVIYPYINNQFNSWQDMSDAAGQQLAKNLYKHFIYPGDNNQRNGWFDRFIKKPIKFTYTEKDSSGSTITGTAVYCPGKKDAQKEFYFIDLTNPKPEGTTSCT